MAQFEDLLRSLQALCSLDNEPDTPRCVAVVLGQAPFAPKEVFLVRLGHNGGQGAACVWDNALAKEATRRILRKLVEALSLAPAAATTSLTRLHVLVLAPRTVRSPFGTPKQQLDLAKQVGKRLVLQVRVAHGEGFEPPTTEDDCIWFSLRQSFQGFAFS